MAKHRDKVPLSQHDNKPVTTYPTEDPDTPILRDQIADRDVWEDPTRKNQPPFSRVGGWIGFFLLGTVFGGSGVIAASLFGYIPPPSISKANNVLALGMPRPSSQPQPKFAEVAEAMKRGDLPKARNGGVETLPITKLEDLAPRCQFQFRSHLQKRTGAGLKIKADDDAIKAGIPDFEQARTAEALLEVANIQIIGDFDKAEKILKDGMERLKDDRFSIALTRLEFRKENSDKKADREDRIWRQGDQGTEAWCIQALLALLAVTLEADPPEKPMADDAWKSIEPGVKLAEAVRLAKAGNYFLAVAALNEAQERLEMIQQTHPGRPVDKVSDPGQDNFKIAYKAMIDAWYARAILKLDNYPGTGAYDLRGAVNAALADARSGSQVVIKLTQAGLITKPEEALIGLDKVISAGKTSAQLVTKLSDGKLIDKPEELLARVHETIKALADAKLVDKPKELLTGADKVITALAEAKKVADESRKTMSQVVTKLTDAKLIDKPEVLLHHHHISDALRRDAKLIGKPEEVLLGLDRAIAAHKGLADAKKVADETRKKLDDVTKLLVDSKFLEAADDALLVPSLREAIRVAEMKDPKGVIRSKTQNTEADWNKLVVVGNFTIKPILFATTKRDKLTDDAEQELTEFAGKFKLQPRYYLRIEGHTLAGGDREASMALAQLRADAVKNFLVKQMGIDEHRLKAVAMEPGGGGREVRLVVLQCR